MQFTLDAEEFAQDLEDALINSLRRSDCVTRHGKNFLVLLSEMTEDDADNIKDRIFSQLKKIPADKISFAREKIF